MVQSSQLETVYLGLGSNLGDRRGFIAAAVSALDGGKVLRDLRVSPLYETDAVADEPQPSFLNAVVRGETDLPPETLLARCLEIETHLGRTRPFEGRKGPRTIDIDLLLYGDRVIDTLSLKVPHPALLSRAFVLIPLGDVAVANLVHPITGAALTEVVEAQGVRKG